MDVRKSILQHFDDLYGVKIETLASTPENIERCLAGADLVIGAVLIPGASAPRLISRAHLKGMRKGAVIVDVAVDQGGCCETTHPTYHDDPIFLVDGIVHYCVANMPGAVPVTSTWGLAQVTLPYALALAEKGIKAAVDDRAILSQALMPIEAISPMRRWRAASDCHARSLPRQTSERIYTMIRA